MSIKVSVYAPALSQAMLAKIADRFGDFGMDCQFHPDFSLDPAVDAGLVPMRLRVLSPESPQYENVDMLSSFEISFKDFRYAAPLSVSPTINEKLKKCTKQVVIRMHATPTSALRAGMYFAALLAEQCDGIVYTPRADKYLEANRALEEMADEVASYETGLPLQDWNVVPFSAWP